MRTLYLLRHGQPAFPDGQRLCLSRTDLPLSTLGHLQAALLGRYLEDKCPLTVFHTGLARTRETAEHLSGTTTEVPSLQELDMGEWEALPFSHIRQQWPELYKARGQAPFEHPAPGGEAPSHCRQRGISALRQLMEETEGDLAVVCHAGVNRLILSALLDGDPNRFLTIPQPYGCVNRLIWEDGRFFVTEVGLLPHPPLDEALCERLLHAAETPEPVRVHSRAVAHKAAELSAGLDVSPDTRTLLAAGLLHDIARTQPDHPALGAQWLEELGYPDVARMISGHHDLPNAEEEALSEAALLYLADKYLQGSREVTLDERFAKSGAALTDEAARAAHARRLAQARRVEQLWKQHRKEAGE